MISEVKRSDSNSDMKVYLKMSCISLILCVPKFTVFNLSIEKIMPWDPCSYLIHYINWLRFQRG